MGRDDKRSVRFYVQQALVEVDYLLEMHAKLIDVEPRLWDGTTRRAIEKAVENIGESVYKIDSLDADFRRAYPQIKWKQIEGMRHRITHEYWAVLPDILWSVLCDHVPGLGDVLREILTVDESVGGTSADEGDQG
jgi:uncharacterized protein with HEPN domain